jgi:hypothetical protein
VHSLKLNKRYLFVRVVRGFIRGVGNSVGSIRSGVGNSVGSIFSSIRRGTIGSRVGSIGSGVGSISGSIGGVRSGVGSGIRGIGSVSGISIISGRLITTASEAQSSDC